MTFLTKRQLVWVLGLTVLAASVRCLPIVVKRTWKSENKNLLYQTDSPGYEQLGIDMQRKGWWLGQDDARTPLYPWFIAKIYQLGGPSPFRVVLAQIFLTALASGVVLWMGIQLGSERLGQVAAILWSFSPATLIYSNYIYTEALYTFIFLFSCAFLLAFVTKKRSPAFLIFSGVGFALATLARPINTFVPLALIFVFAFLPDRSWRRFAVWSTIFLVSYGLGIAPRLVRMKAMTGGVMVSTMMHPNLMEIYVYMDPYLVGKAPFDEQHPPLAYRLGRFFLGKKIDALQRQPPQGSRTTAQEINLWKGKVLEKILRHPGTFIKMYTKGIFTLFFAPASNDFFELWGIPGHRVEFGVRSATGYAENARHLMGGKSVVQLLYMTLLFIISLAVYILFVAGSLAMLRQGQTAAWLVFVIPLTVLTVWVGTHGTLRYRMPMEPLILIIALYRFFPWRGNASDSIAPKLEKQTGTRPSREPVLSA